MTYFADDKVKRYVSKMSYVVSCIVNNQSDVEDVVQEALLRGFRSLGSYRGDSSFETWLCSIARNVALTSRAKQRPHLSLGAEVEELIPGYDLPVDSSLLASEFYTAFHKALDELPDKLRSAFYGHLEGMTQQEIGVQQGCPKGTAGTRVYHARKKLQEMLAEYAPAA